MIQAKLIQDGQTGPRSIPLSQWHIPGRFTVGSWHGTPPKGAVYVRMGILDLNTGQYHISGPKNRLPS